MKDKHRKQGTSTPCSIVLPTEPELLQFDDQDAGTWLELPRNRSFAPLTVHQVKTGLASQTWTWVHLCILELGRQQEHCGELQQHLHSLAVVQVILLCIL